MVRLKKSSNGLIGVDITSATVKLIELKRAGAQYRIGSYAIRPLREGAVVERRIRDMGEVVKALQRAVDHARPTTHQASVAVPASATITKTLTLPASLNDSEIEARIQLDSDKHIPFPFSEVAFDFQRLGLNAHHDDQQDVLLVACRQQDVSQLAEALRQAGLETTAVDVETFAMERVFGELRHQLPSLSGDDDCVALVDIGATMNAFHVLRDGRVIYSHDTVFGGRRLTEEIRSRYGLSLEEAALAKKRGGLPEDYCALVLDPFLDTLVQQVGRSLQLYYTAGRQHEVTRLVLAGGTCVIPGLVDRLAEESGMEVAVANPFLRMKVNSRIDLPDLASDAPAMLTACGLAMRARA
ncbi:pilus assembly protein PilM [Litchfieldella qijiaojingensis]|uniref:Pilus assembly protein PilM n=1 Tax=Litchfieldella qijiaojingensis TaxID=980347 RepID=A0ABQ2YXQ7_9GAMM|nr:type IV pilus assembly protein PilM [Halomonas qijiaojingensis]GGX97294.1 pilus assembly protein PilM [Halomonas qijiaojingensis]